LNAGEESHALPEPGAAGATPGDPASGDIWPNTSVISLPAFNAREQDLKRKELETTDTCRFFRITNTTGPKIQVAKQATNTHLTETLENGAGHHYCRGPSYLGYFCHWLY